MKYLHDLAKTLDSYFVKLPALPKGAKDFIAQISPWLALVFGVLAILAGINTFSGLSLISSFAVLAGVHTYLVTAILSAIILIIQGVIELLAFPSLKAGKIKGWNLLYYSLVLSFLSSVITLNISSMLSSVVGILIGYYFLYQIKSYYK